MPEVMIMRKFWLTVFFVWAISGTLSSGQKIETVGGVRIVHNAKGGMWGKVAQVTLAPVRTLGDVNAPNENEAFFLPANIVVDAASNLYVLDSGNHRIQKFNPEGKYLATFGRKGQGPGEFYYPSWLDIDSQGYLYVSDPNNQRIQVLTPEGKEFKTVRLVETGTGDAFSTTSGNLFMGPPEARFMINPEKSEKTAELPRLIRQVDLKGKVLEEFGVPHDYKDELLNNEANRIIFTVDALDQVYLVFPMQNRLEKYSADGHLLWRADRELSYSMDIQERGKLERKGQSTMVMMPRINRCANGIAADGRGRIWVVTLNRQLTKEEQAYVQVGMSMSTGGERTVGYKVGGNTELQNTDAYKLEIFDPEGVLLGQIPADIFVDGIFIYGDRLFLLDKLRGTKFYEYKIKG
jgi:sugar lactone lactonase YvrE